MKVAVLNLSGNVGKTIVAGLLVTPRIPGMTGKIPYEIESHNTGSDANGVKVNKVSGRMFSAIIDEIMLEDDAVLDVGASQASEFLHQMQQYRGSHEEIDVFLIPVVQDAKVQMDTIKTIEMLKVLGIPKNKIRVVFNKVDASVDALAVDHLFAPIFGLAASVNSFTLNPKAVIYSSDAFEIIKSVGKSFSDITNDTTDYRAKLKDVRGTDTEADCLQMIKLRRLVPAVNDNLDDVFKALFKAK